MKPEAVTHDAVVQQAVGVAEQQGALEQGDVAHVHQDISWRPAWWAWVPPTTV